MSSADATPARAARLLKLATSASVTVALLLVAVKLAAYFSTASVAILASLIDSIMDAGASILNLVAVRYALAPPDAEHRFGHGKAEPLAGLAQSMFIAGSGLFLILEAVQRFLQPQPVAQIDVGIAVMVFATFATLGLVALQHYVIVRTRSTPIRADALHYKADLLTNLAIIAALLLSRAGWEYIDPLFALGIAAFVLVGAFKIGREALAELLDKELPEAERNAIAEACLAHPEVQGVHDMRSRLSGRTRIIQFHLEMDGALPLIEAHRIADEVRDAVVARFPGADVVVHQDPAGLVEDRLDARVAQAQSKR